MDSLRSAARIVASRVVAFCSDCAGKPADVLPLMPKAPIVPGAFVLARGKPSGPPVPGRRHSPALVAVMVVASSALAWCVADPGEARLPLLPRFESHANAASRPREQPAARASLLPPSGLRQLAGPTEMLVVHPLPGLVRELPSRGSRRFGAERDGHGRELGCGEGHCGVDIGEEIGTPILSIADGVVTKVVRFDNPRGGLYVRVDHEDGTTSLYFHLKDIREDLRPGMGVQAGEAIATLGKSGILHSPPHLHFAYAQRDGDRLRYIDPEPLLRDAVLLAVPANVPPDTALAFR